MVLFLSFLSISGLTLVCLGAYLLADAPLLVAVNPWVGFLFGVSGVLLLGGSLLALVP